MGLAIHGEDKKTNRSQLAGAMRFFVARFLLGPAERYRSALLV
jgi:hypothetical protein